MESPLIAKLAIVNSRSGVTRTVALSPSDPTSLQIGSRLTVILVWCKIPHPNTG